MKPDWRSYDAIAETYARVAEDRFAKPARDLVSLLELVPGARVLDVGSGTGVVAVLAASMVGPTGMVVGLDCAIEMVRRLTKRCDAHAVVAVLPRLPHPDSSFDATAASFVLSHVADLAGALEAMVRALRPGGRLAVSSWTQTESSSAPGGTWQAVMGEFVSDENLRTAIKAALPSEEKSSDPAFLEAALSAAGLIRTGISERTYSIEMTTRSFVEMRLISSYGRFARSILPDVKWARLQEESYRRLAAMHGARVSFDLRAIFAFGCKPASTPAPQPPVG